MTVVTTLTPTVGDTLIPPWQSEQEPRVREVAQNRITAVGGTDVPGSGSYKPAVALRTELRPFHNNDLTITAIADASASAIAITVSAPQAASLVDRDFMLNTRTNEMLRVNGTPSGTSLPVRRAMTNYGAAAAILTGDTFTVPGGDISDSGGDYATSRTEVYARFAPFSTDPPETWPDPVGSERWYSWSQYVPSDFPTNADTANYWTLTTQWKGAFGGSPPFSIEIVNNSYRFGGTRTYRGPSVIPNVGNIGALNKGQWTQFTVGFKWSTTTTGWVEVWRDGAQVIARTAVDTMDLKVDGVTADPVYFKQGIYRSTNWTGTQIIYYSPVTISDSYFDFGQAPSPSVVLRSGEYWGMAA
jgi:hypothetical protein